MPESIHSKETIDALSRARQPVKKTISISGKDKEILTPFPSPEDWRDKWIYFIMVDRFNNPDGPPNGKWDSPFNSFQGGTINGIRKKLDYIKGTGAGAIWLSPVVKNCKEHYHGYGFQDLLSVDPRFGTEDELRALVDEAHARDIYVILDIVLNHAGNVFAYPPDNNEADWSNTPYEIFWRDETGKRRMDWNNPPPDCSPDAAVWPKELRRNEYFRRCGKGSSSGGNGDFCSLKELCTDYQEWPDGKLYYPVRDTLIKAYQYLIAKYDIDGFRIDTLKFIETEFARTFGNSMREFALSIGKKNFFTFGEIWADEKLIDSFIGRTTDDNGEIIGVDAALDFPLFYKLAGAAKGSETPMQVMEVFKSRKDAQKMLISSHGEAGKYFVTFLDNHDQNNRFYYSAPDGRYDLQVTLGITLLFNLQGIPCVYYGTEQGLHGSGNRVECVREALWGKDDAFDVGHPFYKAVQLLSAVKESNPALRYGRQYFREISGNGRDFGFSEFAPGVMAFSRILGDTEVLIAANASDKEGWEGHVIVDFALNPEGTPLKVFYSNVPNAQSPGPVTRLDIARGSISAAQVKLRPMEVQIIGK